MIYRPGAKVTAKSDTSYTGRIVGPSGYEGGVIVNFDNGQKYPCSNVGLVIDEAPEGIDLDQMEIADFDNWQFWQSHETLRRETAEQVGLYREDIDWHHRSKGNGYRSRA